MASTTKILTVLSLCLPLFAAGCKGYTMVPYTGFPYGDSRMAGSGVAYVKAKMMEERGPVIKAEQPENKTIVETKKIVDTKDKPNKAIMDQVEADLSEKVFNAMQKK